MSFTLQNLRASKFQAVNVQNVMFETPFSFRKVREMDTLRYTESDHRKRRRHSSLSRSMPIARRSKSQWPAFDRSLPDCENPTYFEMEKMRLENEIRVLADEVEPLREKCREMIGSPMPGRRRKIYRRQSVREFDVYERPPPVGVTAAELMELQRELKATKDECARWKDELKSVRLERLRDDILLDIEEVNHSLRKYQQAKAEEDEYRREIRNYAVSVKFDQVQEQREYIENMREILRGEVEKHRTLKKKYVKLKNRDYPRLSDEEIEALPEIVELNRKLERALDDMKSAKDRYLDMRETQIQEVQTIYNLQEFRDSYQASTPPSVPIDAAFNTYISSDGDDEEFEIVQQPRKRIFKYTALQTPREKPPSKTHSVFHASKKHRQSSPRRTK